MGDRCAERKRQTDRHEISKAPRFQRKLEEARPTAEMRLVSFLMLFYLSFKNCVKRKMFLC